MFAIFVYWRIIFIKCRRSLSADAKKVLFFMRINGNFVMMVGLTDNERCLIHNLLVEKLWGSEIIMKIFVNI